VSRARLARWVVPGAALTIAVAGLAFLVVADAAPAARWRSATPLEAPAGARAARAESGPAAGRVRRPLPRPAAPAAPARPRRAAPAPARETARVLAATPELARLARAPDLAARLAIVDEIVAARGDGAAPTLEGLLDSELPGSLYEVENLRLALLARLGEIPGPESRAVLVARLDAERPRPQRLIALELLAGRGEGSCPAVESIARRDHDTLVREKARAVLARN